MKIGILTFHRALNYGAVLQCYALFETIKGMGHDVEVIDYRPPYIEKYRRLFYWKDFKKMKYSSMLKYLLTLPFIYINKRKAAKSFDNFLNNHLVLSCPVYSAKDIPSYYDTIVFGSDQIWNPRICDGFDPVFWGQFAKGKTKFVAYAASLEGYHLFSKSQWETIVKLQKNFDAISVREETFCKELVEHSKRNVQCVIDPTLLAPPTLLKQLVQKPLYKRYIFLFLVQKGNTPYLIAQHLSKKIKCEIVISRARPRLESPKNTITLDAIMPQQFVELISGAECIVTNSFHATAISLQLEKEFYAVQCERPNRIKNILNAVNLNDRYISKTEDIDHVKPIDYLNVHKHIKILADSSTNYLVDCFYSKKLAK